MQCSMAWALHRTEKEKPAAGKTDYWRDFWRSGWDSNPRNLAVQLISSQSRYDHFDTAPYLSQHQHLGKRGELMGRTSKNIKLRIPEKLHKIKGFRSGSYRVATTISSRSRYDHFDTSPYLIFKHRLARPSDKCKISMQDTREKFRYTPRIQPRVKPNPADESARKPQTFEFRTFDHSDNSPDWICIVYYSKIPAARQFEICAPPGFFRVPFRFRVSRSGSSACPPG